MSDSRHREKCDIRNALYSELGKEALKNLEEELSKEHYTIQDIQYLCEHLGLKKGGASWCALHKPIDIITCRVCNTKEEAAAMEVMLTALHQAQIGYQHCRGGRWNMPGDMKKEAATL